MLGKIRFFNYWLDHVRNWYEFLAVFSSALSFTYLKSNMYTRKNEKKKITIFPPSHFASHHTLLLCLSALPLIPFMFILMPKKNGYLWLIILLFSPYWIISIIRCTKVTMRTEKMCKIKSARFLICTHLKTGVGWGGSKKSEPDKLCLCSSFCLFCSSFFCLLLHDKWLCCPELKAEYSLPFFILYPFRVTSCWFKVFCRTQVVYLLKQVFSLCQRMVKSHWRALALSHRENIPLPWTAAWKCYFSIIKIDIKTPFSLL